MTNQGTDKEVGLALVCGLRHVRPLEFEPVSRRRKIANLYPRTFLKALSFCLSQLADEVFVDFLISITRRFESVFRWRTMILGNTVQA